MSDFNGRIPYTFYDENLQYIIDNGMIYRDTGHGTREYVAQYLHNRIFEPDGVFSQKVFLVYDEKYLYDYNPNAVLSDKGDKVYEYCDGKIYEVNILGDRGRVAAHYRIIDKEKKEIIDGDNNTATTNMPVATPPVNLKELAVGFGIEAAILGLILLTISGDIPGDFWVYVLMSPIFSAVGAVGMVPFISYTKLGKKLDASKNNSAYNFFKYFGMFLISCALGGLISVPILGLIFGEPENILKNILEIVPPYLIPGAISSVIAAGIGTIYSSEDEVVENKPESKADKDYTKTIQDRKIKYLVNNKNFSKALDKSIELKDGNNVEVDIYENAKEKIIFAKDTDLVIDANKINRINSFKAISKNSTLNNIFTYDTNSSILKKINEENHMLFELNGKKDFNNPCDSFKYYGDSVINTKGINSNKSLLASLYSNGETLMLYKDKKTGSYIKKGNILSTSLNNIESCDINYDEDYIKHVSNISGSFKESLFPIVTDEFHSLGVFLGKINEEDKIAIEVVRNTSNDEIIFREITTNRILTSQEINHMFTKAVSLEDFELESILNKSINDKKYKKKILNKKYNQTQQIWYNKQ